MQIAVGLGLSGLMLVGVLRYLGLQRKLMTSAYLFLIVLRTNAPEATVFHETGPKS